MHKASRLWALAVIGLMATLSQTVQALTVTRGPYLQIGGPNGIVIRWRTDTASESRVRYGAAPGSLIFVADNPVVSTEHEVSVPSLTADSVYYYSVGTVSTV